MLFKGALKLNGKNYDVEVIDGVRFVEGKTVEEFVRSLDPITRQDLADVAIQALKDQATGTKPFSYLEMVNNSYLSRNN